VIGKAVDELIDRVVLPRRTGSSGECYGDVLGLELVVDEAWARIYKLSNGSFVDWSTPPTETPIPYLVQRSADPAPPVG